MEFSPSIPLDVAQDQPAQLFYNLFLALVGFWRTPSDDAVIKIIETAAPEYPNLALTIVPIGQRLTISIVAAVLDGMLADLWGDSHPKFGGKTLTTKAPPPIIIGVIGTRFVPDPVPATLTDSVPLNSSALAIPEGNGASQTTTVSIGHISATVHYRGQGTRYPKISAPVWLQNFHLVNREFLRDNKSTDDIATEWEAGGTSTKPFSEVRAHFAGVDFVTRLWISIPSDGHLLAGELMSGMVGILQKVTTKRKFGPLEGTIFRDEVQVAALVYQWGSPVGVKAEQDTIATA